MVSLKPDVHLGLNKLIEFIFPKNEQYINEKIIYYLRMYTDLIQAEGALARKDVKKAMNLIKVVRNMAKSSTFKEEKVFCQRIFDISQELFTALGKLAVKWASPDNVHTKLQLAQNICILRILKRDSK